MDVRRFVLNTSRLLPAVLCLPFFLAPSAGHAQTAGTTVTVPIWGDWQAAPGFPGIKIRVICQAFHADTGLSEWNFQFQNTYPKKVHLLYQQETHDSSGNPPSFEIPDAQELKPKEESPVYADSLKGTCQQRKLIYLGVVSIDPPKKPAPTARPVNTASTKAKKPPVTEELAAGPAATQPGPSQTPQVPQQASQLVPQSQIVPASSTYIKPIGRPAPAPVSMSDVVGGWRCNFNDNPMAHTFRLDADGFGYGFFGLTSWSLKNNILEWTDHSGQLRFEGEFLDAKTLDGTVVFTEDLNFLPNHKRYDTVHCTAQY